MTRKRFIFATFGSLGDLHPFIAIARELNRRGHRPLIASFAEFREAVEAAGVEFEPLITISDIPAEGIVDAAQERKCDAIFLASHGRSGVSRLILGSVTQEVLARSTLPVIVFR